MNNDPLDHLAETDSPVPAPPSTAADALARRLGLQRRTTEAAADTTSVIPYLVVDNASRAIEFYTSVFGASLHGEPFVTDDGRIGHAELRIGDVTIYLSDEFPDINITAPSQTAHTVSIVIHVGDTDLCMAAAEASGALIQSPAQNRWNARSGWFLDPFGHRWSPTSHTTPQPSGATT